MIIEQKRLYEVAIITDSLHQTPSYVSDGIPMVRVTDVKPGYLSLNQCFKVSEDDYVKFTTNHIPQRGDIIISRVGSYGNFSFVSSDERFCLGQNTAIISPLINPEYLYYYLSSALAKAQIESVVVGSTQKTISLKSIKELSIPVFDNSTQDRIASILGDIDRKINCNIAINQNLQEQAKAIYTDMIIDKADETWIPGTLSDVAIVTMGQSPKGDTYNEDSTGTVFFQGRAEFGFRFPTRRLYTTDPKRMAQSNDALMSVRAPVGDMNVAYEDCCIGRGLSSIRSKDGHQSYILYTMFALRNQLDVFNGEGTVFGSINRDALNAMPISIPPKYVMDQFEALVSPMDVAIRNNYEEICRLEALRDLLLPRLMSGELDVSDIDI